MKVSTTELESKLIKILKVQQRPEVSMALYEELAAKSLKYKEIIDFLKDDDIDKYLTEEEQELDEALMAKHTKQ